MESSNGNRSLQENDVWDETTNLTGRKIVGSKWVFKKKTGADGTVERYKVRLVAHTEWIMMKLSALK